MRGESVSREQIHPQLAGLAMPVEALTPDPKNARRHDQRNVDAIAESLREHGQRKPIVAQKVGETLVVRAGNGTLEAARKLGWERLAVLVVDEGDREATRYALRDNRTAELAEWDDEALRQALRECAESEAEIAAEIAALGWNPDEFRASSEADGADREEAEKVAKIGLFEEFLVPPFSVLDARKGYWQDRKRMWSALGIASEKGRDESLINHPPTTRFSNFYEVKAKAEKDSGRSLSVQDVVRLRSSDLRKTAALDGTSIFDPALAEVLVSWFSPPSGRVLDPFAGGSVRGVVSGWLGRSYVGVDLREEQIEENRAQAERIFVGSGRETPRWIVGDAQDVATLAADGAPYDLVLTCPPYADLEVYSEDPRDLSTMDYPEFLAAYTKAIAGAASLLAPDRFFAIVVGEVREKKGGGIYRGFVPDTIRACEAAGLSYYNEMVLVMPGASLPIRARNPFAKTRKIGKLHQNVLVFVKGDPRKATEACGPVQVLEEPEGIES